MIFFHPISYVPDKLHFIPYFQFFFSSFTEPQKSFSPAKMLSLVALILISIWTSLFQHILQREIE